MYLWVHLEYKIFVGTFGIQNMYDIYAHKYYYFVVQIWEQK